MYTSLENSFSLLSYDTLIMMEGSRMTEQGQFVLCNADIIQTNNYDEYVYDLASVFCTLPIFQPPFYI